MPIIIAVVAGVAAYVAATPEPSTQGITVTLIICILAACIGTWLARR